MALRALLIGIIFFLLSATTAVSSDKSVVFVSVLPQKYFVQQISGDKIQVEVMVKPGASPATYEPKPSQMRMLSETDIYFAVGVPFEKNWLSKIAGVNQEMVIVHTDAGIEKIMMADTHSDVTEEKDEHGSGHEHGGFDPHIWLSPELVKIQAGIMEKSLSIHYPQWEPLFRENLTKFIESIDQLDREVRSVMKGAMGAEFMVFHPSWGYFARDYGMVQIPIEVEGKKPKSSQLHELIEHAREHDIKIIFAQPQFSRKSAGVIAQEIGGHVIFIDPLAENWAENLKEVSEKIGKTIN